MPMVGSLS